MITLLRLHEKESILYRGMYLEQEDVETTGLAATSGVNTRGSAISPPNKSADKKRLRYRSGGSVCLGGTSGVVVALACRSVIFLSIVRQGAGATRMARVIGQKYFPPVSRSIGLEESRGRAPRDVSVPISVSPA